MYIKKLRLLVILPVLFVFPALAMAETSIGYSMMGSSMSVSGTSYTASGSRIYAGMSWPLGKVFVTGPELSMVSSGTVDFGGSTAAVSSTGVNWTIGPRFGNFGIDVGVAYMPYSITYSSGNPDTGTTTGTLMSIKYRILSKVSLRYETLSYSVTASGTSSTVNMGGLGVSVDF